ncbi:unnamed protein product [Fraxinus pennsylvanica]|uniref:Receptor-like serine/threonine-protein kinase n=1 Tax=Fraxinus pennsylvanica TaxID=56036 RepID=A0AAD2A0E3_9LAMI|nr:unnamed protein product [Fraxinus pennsylvanica]
MAASAQKQRYSNISLGSSLEPNTNSSWLSPSGLYAFGFYKLTNGYAVGVFIAGIPEKTVVWTANRDDPVFPTNAILLLTDYGRLILKQDNGDDINIASSVRPVVSASMLDNGNFVLYDSSRRIAWQSFDSPTDTLLPGQRLPPGMDLVSSASKTNPARGIFRLAMQTDGHLAQYPVEISGASYAYYASGTIGTGNNVSLNLDNNGLLYLFNGSSAINLTTGQYRKRTIYLVRIDVDGIFRLYYRSLDPQGNWTKEWSPTEDKCAPLGLCGLNGYCIQLDTVAECECLPGFDRVSPGNSTSGCERNFVMEGCKAEEQNVSYEIISLDNVVWEDVNYGVLVSMTKADCAKACLEDCNCDAALFKDGNCRKQRLPLRYGRRVQSNPTVSLIKVNTTAPLSPGVSSGSGKEIKKEIRLDVLIISISLFALAAFILAISGIYVHRNHVGRYKKIPHVGLIEDVGLRAFTYPELVEATNEFKEKLGRGASGIRGTRGYVAPEWHKKLPVTVKVDVYSYGIVLLEIICGRKSVDSSLSEDEAILEEWVYNAFESGELSKLVGEEEVDERKLERLIKIGIWCIQDEPSLRPSMKKVLLMLEGNVDIPLPPSPTSFISTF